VGVVEPTTMTWFLRNSNDSGPPNFAPFSFGGVGMIPVVGDWDGDGITTVGVFDPGTGNWFLRNSNTPGAPNFPVFSYGGLGWKPVVGDWDNNGTTTVGVFDPGTGNWYQRNSNTSGPPDTPIFAYGGLGWTPVAGNWIFPPPLQAAAGPAPLSNAKPLTQQELDATVAGALARLRSSGVDANLVNSLAQLRFEVAPLSGATLGLADLAGGRIVIDSDAAGYGWFVDSTPTNDEEFTNISGRLTASSGPAARKMDLLTAVLHELGHVQGQSDLDSPLHADELMASALEVGVRRVNALDEVFATW